MSTDDYRGYRQDGGKSAEKEPTAGFNKILEVLYPAILLTIAIGVLFDTIRQDVGNAVLLMLSFAFLFTLIHVIDFFLLNSDNRNSN